MKKFDWKFDWKYAPVFVIFALSMALAPVFRAQDQSVTRITPMPDGAEYMVDGQSYQHASSAVWPAGSKHTLWVPTTTQTGQLRTQYVFRDWEFSGGPLPFNPVTVTASPAITEYRAVFDSLYDLGLVFFNCPDASNCQSPGVISVNGCHTIRRPMCTCQRTPRRFCRRIRTRDMSSWGGKRAQTRRSWASRTR